MCYYCKNLLSEAITMSEKTINSAPLTLDEILEALRSPHGNQIIASIMSFVSRLTGIKEAAERINQQYFLQATQPKSKTTSLHSATNQQEPSSKQTPQENHSAQNNQAQIKGQLSMIQALLKQCLMLSPSSRTLTEEQLKELLNNFSNLDNLFAQLHKLAEHNDNPALSQSINALYQQYQDYRKEIQQSLNPTPSAPVQAQGEADHHADYTHQIEGQTSQAPYATPRPQLSRKALEEPQEQWHSAENFYSAKGGLTPTPQAPKINPAPEGRPDPSLEARLESGQGNTPRPRPPQ
jgi:hypothetical protein